MKICTGGRPADVKQLDAALTKVNGRATQHTYTALGLYRVASELEARLEALGIPKKDRKGATASATSGGRVPNAYKYKRIGTHAKLERGAKDWYVVGLEAATLYENGGDVKLHLTPEQDALAIAAMRKKHNYTTKG